MNIFKIAGIIVICSSLLITAAQGQNINDGKYAAALTEVRRLAEQGDAEAQFNLGVMYAQGQGTPQSYPDALKWYRKAAEQGNANAQFNLGVMYDQGQGTPQSYPDALKWYRKAAEQGHVDAQYNLGVMYWFGQGTLQNHIMAHMWFNLSASQGDKKAAELRNRIASEMTPDSVLSAQELATKCLAQNYKNCGK